MPKPITQEISAYAVESHYADLPMQVKKEASRAFLNWIGCVLGGCGEKVAINAAAGVPVTSEAPHAMLIGHGQRSDLASAAFVNCVSSSALAYDDTHLATVTHPTGPVAAALLAYAETVPISGPDFLNALALGIEIQCRLSNVLLLPPAKSNHAIYITGLTGPIGATIALGRVMKLDKQRMVWAIGLAATQAAGFRATHGSMAGLVVPAFGARTSIFATQLALSSMDCSENILEGSMGFVEIFSPQGNLDRAIDDLGVHFELLSNTYKPYPAGIVVHATIDACMELLNQMPTGSEVQSVKLIVHPLALKLADRRHPATPLEAQVSLYHWAAAIFLRGSANIETLRQDVIDAPDIAALRKLVEAQADPSLGRDEAKVEAVLTCGAKLHSHVHNARGSIARPMTDDELDTKFLDQAKRVLPLENAEELMCRLRNLEFEDDVGRALQDALKGHGHEGLPGSSGISESQSRTGKTVNTKVQKGSAWRK